MRDWFAPVLLTTSVLCVCLVPILSNEADHKPAAVEETVSGKTTYEGAVETKDLVSDIVKQINNESNIFRSFRHPDIISQVPEYGE